MEKIKNLKISTWETNEIVLLVEALFDELRDRNYEITNDEFENLYDWIDRIENEICDFKDEFRKIIRSENDES